MKKYTVFLLVLVMIIISGCTNNLYSNKETTQSTNSNMSETSNQVQPTEDSKESTDANKSTEVAGSSQKPEAAVIDYNLVKPDESGQIMVVMFHNFIETYTKGDKEFTTTFSDFEKLLPKLYEKKYRLISLTDMLNNNINVPAGCIPMVFTFDDGTVGQFNLIEKDGKLVANPKSAIGIMEAFNEKHPDFGLKGTFYVNLGLKTTFKGSGTIPDRLNYLIGKGIEIGNHTKNHVFLPDIKTSKEMLEEIGGNQKLMNEFVPGYTFDSLALPNGASSKAFKEYTIHGNYEGIEYKHSSIVLVGANPAPSPVSTKFNPLALPRVRSTGLTKVECDLSWWLDTLSKGKSQFVSDGNANTVAVPKSNQKNVDMAKLNGKQLLTY
ncbi:MAG: polysaccharide deacetylase family protein [Ruminiclostridium sp.]